MLRLSILMFFTGMFSVRISETSEKTYPFYSGYVNERIVESVNSIYGDLIVVSDSLPVFYFIDIETGVCYDHVCKPAFLRIFWDASGSFLGFKIPDNTPLTKVNHVEFTAYDYYLLFSILNNPHSILGKMHHDELTSNKGNAKNEMDGTTGATTVIDKNAVVSGAVFTCYTLWHIVNDTTLVQKIQEDANNEFKNLNFQTNKNDLNTIKNKMHPATLAMALLASDSEKKLRKLKYQKVITADMDNNLPINSLMINNYLSRQVFVFPEIEKRLAKCEKNEFSFSMMLNVDL